MTTQTPREIAFEDIREGDRIEAAWSVGDREEAYRGVAAYISTHGAWCTEEGRPIAWAGPNITYTLLHRPAVTEPKGLGAVVRARTRSGSREGQFVHIRAELGTERWQGPGGGIYYWSDFDPDSIEVLSEGIEVES